MCLLNLNQESPLCPPNAALSLHGLTDTSPPRPPSRMRGCHPCLEVDLASRTFNKIDVDVYLQPWSKAARKIWVHLLMIQPNAYGLFESPFGTLLDFWSEEYDKRQVRKALEELQDEGVLKIYPKTDTWWVVKKFKRELKFHQSARHFEGVKNHLKLFPEVEKDFKKEYFLYFESFKRSLNGDSKGLRA